MKKTTSAHHSLVIFTHGGRPTGEPSPDPTADTRQTTRGGGLVGAGLVGAGRLDMRSELPKLVSCRQIQEELGVTRATAEAVMRQLEKIRFPGSRRVYVRRRDVDRLIEESTTR